MTATALLAVSVLGALSFGGTAQTGSALTTVARFGALPALAAGMAIALSTPPRGSDPLVWITVGVVLIPLIQLVPVPERLVEALPGRQGLLSPLAAVGVVRPPWTPLSLAPAATYDAFLATLGPAGIVLLGRSAELRRPEIVLWVVLAIALVSVPIGVLQRSGGDASPLRLYAINSAGEAIGFFANRDHFAIFLVCVLPVIGYLAGRPAVAERSGVLLAAAGATVAVLGGIAMTRSRAGVILGAAAFVASAFQFHLVRREAGWGRPATPGEGLRYGALVLAGPLLLALVFAATGGLDRLVHDASPDGRVQFWGPILRLALRFFPAGAGIGAFDPLWRTVEPFDRLTGFYLNHAHNDYLEGLLETGLPGLILLVAFLIWWGRAATRAWRGDPWRTALPRVGVVVTAVLMLHSMVDYPLRTPALATLFAFACVLMAAAGGERSGPARP